MEEVGKNFRVRVKDVRLGKFWFGVSLVFVKDKLRGYV